MNRRISCRVASFNTLNINQLEGLMPGVRHWHLDCILQSRVACAEGVEARYEIQSNSGNLRVNDGDSWCAHRSEPGRSGAVSRFETVAEHPRAQRSGFDGAERP